MQAHMPNKQKSIIGVLLFSVVFILICIRHYAEFAFMMPNGIHEGAQSDRLALAIQFYDNGMNFFLPRTYHIGSIDAVTPTEFPLQSYLAACLGKIFGRESISVCFRLLTLFITYLGLLALYKICYRATRDMITSLFIPLFLFASPVFAFYACNYLPDIAAVSFSFIGLYYFIGFLKSSSFRQLVYAIALLTLATLVKTTLGIVLLTVMAYTLFHMLFVQKPVDRKPLAKTLLVFALSFVPIIGYYFYNQYLSKHYNAYLFLMRANPFKDMEAVKLYFQYSIRHSYVNEYYITLQYPFIALLFSTGLYTMLTDPDKRRYLFFFFVLFCGSIAATFLFGQQLIHHDYYFISIWHATLTISMLVFIIWIRKSITDAKTVSLFNIGGIASLVIILLFAQNFFSSRATLEEYRYPGLKKTIASNWMKNGAEKLDKLNISRNTPILVLDEESPNTALVYFDRKGVQMGRGWWPGDMNKVTKCMNENNIRIMVCDARKMPEIKATYAHQFPEMFTELYIDDYCAVYRMND